MLEFQSALERLISLSPGVWLVTGGTRTGVMKLVGKAFKNLMLTRLPEDTKAIKSTSASTPDRVCYQ